MSQQNMIIKHCFGVQATLPARTNLWGAVLGPLSQKWVLGILLLCMWICVFKVKAANIYDFIISKGQECGGSLAGWFWPRVFHEVAVKVSFSAALSESLTGSLGSTPRQCIIGSTGLFIWLLAGGLSFFHLAINLSVWLLECLHDKATSFPQSEQSKREGRTAINMAFWIVFLRFTVTWYC